MASILLGLTGLDLSGGIAVVTRCVVRVLEEQVRAGRVSRLDRVLLHERSDCPRRPLAPGEQLLARGSQSRFLWQVWRCYRRHRHELVFFDHLGLARSVMVPLPGFPPPRYAIFVHGVELKRALGGSRARAVMDADQILTNSRFTANAVLKEFPQLADRVHPVQLCIEPERVEAWSTLVPERLSPLRTPAVLIVSRLWSEECGKGHDELLEGWPAVRRRVPNAELWVVGDGDDAERLRRKARECGVAESVRFFGYVSNEELGSLYRRASLFAMPSRQEGFGLVYAEAMWFGLPCVGSTADAAGEVIVDGETGVLVPYGAVEPLADAVAGLLADPARAREMGRAARRRAEQRFSFERFRSNLLAALELT